MKALTRSLQSVVKNLQTLTEKTQKIIEKLEMDKNQEVKKVPTKKVVSKTITSKKKVTRRPVKKEDKATATDTVLELILKNKKGIGATELREKTGFNEKKIWNIINRLKKQKKIKSMSRGQYMKV